MKTYTTVDFRKHLSEALANARYKDVIVNVLHHGKPFVSIISGERGEVETFMNKQSAKIAVAEMTKLLNQNPDKDTMTLSELVKVLCTNEVDSSMGVKTHRTRSRRSTEG